MLTKRFPCFLLVALSLSWVSFLEAFPGYKIHHHTHAQEKVATLTTTVTHIYTVTTSIPYSSSPVTNAEITETENWSFDASSSSSSNNIITIFKYLEPKLITKTEVDSFKRVSSLENPVYGNTSVVSKCQANCTINTKNIEETPHSWPSSSSINNDDAYEYDVFKKIIIVKCYNENEKGKLKYYIVLFFSGLL